MGTKGVALVLGLGRFGGGAGAVHHLLQDGSRVRVADREDETELREAVAAVGEHERLEWCLGRQDEALLRGVSRLVVNPAVPSDHLLVSAARDRGIELTQEMNLFLEAYPGKIVLVTGTNGKTTTATLLASALGCAGVPTLLGGNMGHSLLTEQDRWRADQIAVLEASSFQLERIDVQRHRVAGAVFTPVTKDHLDRHKTVAAYAACKARAALIATQFVVLPQTGSPLAATQHYRAHRVIRCRKGSPDRDEVGYRDGWLWSELKDRSGPILHRDALRLEGDFQADNAVAAFAAAMALGVDRHAAAFGLAATEPLPHRFELVASIRGVSIYDNGVSTQTASTESAIRNLQGKVHWIGGGKLKDEEPRSVARSLRPLLASAHLFGAVGPELLGSLRPLPATCHDKLEDAAMAALEVARPGSNILFSPSFSSFDQYANFRQRAEAFRRWLARLTGPDEDTSGDRG